MGTPCKKDFRTHSRYTLKPCFVVINECIYSQNWKYPKHQSQSQVLINIPLQVNKSRLTVIEQKEKKSDPPLIFSLLCYI